MSPRPLPCAFKVGGASCPDYLSAEPVLVAEQSGHKAPPTFLLLALLAILLATGCQAPDASRATSNEGQPYPSHSGEITPGSPAYNAWRTKAKSGHAGKTDADVITEGEILQLPKFVVQEKGFVDFGFSIITNEEVLRGKPVKWVQIGVVLPGSIAEQHKLTTGTKIVAIDDVPVTDLLRDDLQFLLFEREPGDHVRLLVLSRHMGLLPIFVELGAPPMPLD